MIRKRLNSQRQSLVEYQFLRVHWPSLERIPLGQFRSELAFLGSMDFL